MMAEEIPLDASKFAPALALASLVLILASLAVLYMRKGSSGLKRNNSATALVGAEEGLNGRQRVSIFYGTQTGTSERFAKELAAEVSARYPTTAAVAATDLENVDETIAEERLADETLCIFLKSTYGDGEPTDTAAPFFTWLMDKAENDCNGQLANINYAVFGLGSTQYEYFNAAGKALDKAMAQLGGNRMTALGLGNDDQDIAADFESWKEGLWPALEAAFPSLVDSAAAGMAPAAPAEYEVSLMPSAPKPKAKGAPFDMKNPYPATVAVRSELHSARSDRSCLHVEFDIAASGMTYEHGDHLGVVPQNNPAVVAAAAAKLGFPESQAFKLSCPAGSSLTEPFPTPCTLGHALANYCDILTPPRKLALNAMAACCADESEAARLRELASDKKEYAAFVEEPARTVLEVLDAFPSCKPTLGAFFASMTSKLQVRYYSISSAPAAGAGSVSATMAVVRGATPTGRVHEGVATTLLERTAVGGKVPVFVRGSAFKLPPSPATPVVMIGPGTGLAPFRGFLQERAGLMAAGAKLGPAHFFFGCRSPEVDFIYEEELGGYVRNGVLSELHVAFSRHPTQKKEYVQHQLAAKADAVYAALSAGGYLYVCGDAKSMAKDVHHALIDMVAKKQRIPGTKAEKWVEDLTKAGRYQRDVW